MPNDQEAAPESYSKWRDFSSATEKNLRHSKGKSSTVSWTSWGNLEDCRHESVAGLKDHSMRSNMSLSFCNFLDQILKPVQTLRLDRIWASPRQLQCPLLRERDLLHTWQGLKPGVEHTLSWKRTLNKGTKADKEPATRKLEEKGMPPQDGQNVKENRLKTTTLK